METARDQVMKMMREAENGCYCVCGENDFYLTAKYIDSTGSAYLVLKCRECKESMEVFFEAE